MEAKAERLKSLILEMRGSQGLRAFARVVGVSPGAVHNWQEGTHQPDRNGLQKLAHVKGWTLDEMVSYLNGESINQLVTIPNGVTDKELREILENLSQAQAREAVKLLLPIAGFDDLDNTEKDASIVFSKGVNSMNFSQILQRFLGATPPDIVDAQLIKKQLTRSRLNELVGGGRPTDEEIRQIGAILGDVGFKDSRGLEYSVEQLAKIVAGSSITNGASSR